MAVAPAPPGTAEALIERVQRLQDELEEVADGAARALADELVSAVVQMYGEGLGRIVQAIPGAASPEELAERLADDPVVAMLLLIHDLHPVPLEVRVHEALERVRPYMESHGGNVELLSLDGGVARLRLEGSCSDCSASAVTLELAIKQALEEAAPDLEGLEVEGVVAGASGVHPADSAWVPVPASSLPAAGALAPVVVDGARLVVAAVDGMLLAYRDGCAECGGSLASGALADGVLRCPECSRCYGLTRAGRSLDGDGLQLEPVPLLEERGTVRVALAR